MNIDLDDMADPSFDEEGSTVSVDDQPVEDTSDVLENEEILAKYMEATTLALDGIDLEEIFSLLPNPDLEDVAEGEAGPGPSTTTYRANLKSLWGGQLWQLRV
ncbi:hypothetical protein F5890DRAFT_1558478 [Lentinula detonsa]|uniref:Uncharacterized protein n=1 Tax=Lentinula detonsa TaxID=2804962 RepID=A0AA38UPZ5_9AGAR|nr:hypothetical protein F5890DRAFT_1558478 [Lentinula detonsa]